MTKTFENAPSSPESKREVTLDCEQLKIADPDKLKDGLKKIRDRVFGAVTNLEEMIRYYKKNRVSKSAVDEFINNATIEIERAHELGIDVTDLEAKFKNLVEVRPGSWAIK